MVGESIAILTVLIAAAAMALRSRRQAVVTMTLPFCAVPLAYLLGEAFFFSFRPALGVPLQTFRVLIVLLGGVIGVALAFVVAKRISAHLKNAKRLYTPFALVFVAAMAIAYCIRLLG